DTDAQSRYLVTAAEDKTIRVWELATGRLLNIIRPPIGDGKEGMLRAVAISPDGETIAAGGVTGRAWDGASCIYIFERGSGKLVHRITGLPINVFDSVSLAYSRNGQFLIVGLHGSVRLYDARTHALLLEDTTAFFAEAEPGGKLVTASHDG